MEEGIPTDRLVRQAYQDKAADYDRSVKTFDLLAWMGFSISGWRREAIAQLQLKPGDTVIDIGCGTGLNFPILQELVGPEGQIIGIDLSTEMLAEAQHTADARGWNNVWLECTDAARFDYPKNADAILSTYVLILVPTCGEVVARACGALKPGGRFAVLDMAWPSYMPLWFRHFLPFLKTYGVDEAVLERRAWESVQGTMVDNLTGISLKKYWFQFFYRCSGVLGPNSWLTATPGTVAGHWENPTWPSRPASLPGRRRDGIPPGGRGSNALTMTRECPCGPWDLAVAMS